VIGGPGRFVPGDLGSDTKHRWTLAGKQAIGAVEIFVRADRRCDRTDLRLFERAGLTGNSRMTGVVSTDTVPHRVQ